MRRSRITSCGLTATAREESKGKRKEKSKGDSGSKWEKRVSENRVDDSTLFAPTSVSARLWTATAIPAVAGIHAISPSLRQG